MKKNYKYHLYFLLLAVTISCSNNQTNSQLSSHSGSNRKPRIPASYTEITDPNQKANLSNFYKFNITGEDNITKSYIEKENVVENGNEEAEIDIRENKVFISEYEYMRTDYYKNKEEFKNIKIFGKTNDNVNTLELGHGEEVLKAFLDSNYDGYKNEKKNTLDENAYLNMSDYIQFEKNKKDYSGIVNMSYGSTTYVSALNKLNPNSKYIDKSNTKYFSKIPEYFSDLVQNPEYKKNKWLKVISLGNKNDIKVKGKWYSSILLSKYQNLSEELQKAARSEVILVKNSFYKNDYQDKALVHEFQTTKSGKKVVEVYDEVYAYGDNENSRYDASALALRSMTIGALGVNYSNGFERKGSSFSSPRITRLAYEVKNKFPYLTLHQVKEVIFGTADHDESGYLNDINGWGQVNYKKAMNGPSDFNAGLIDETKFFDGWYSKTFDNEGNRYFYVDTKGIDSEWSNDITSGLKGDGNTKKYRIYPIIDAKEKIFNYRLAKVLDSERLFYSNVATAGLRKDGNGDLILSGRQLYNDKIQVLGGSLTLKNSANSKEIDVFNEATLNLDGKSKIEINDIVSDGRVNFKTNVDMKDYRASTSSNTILNPGVNIKAKSFKVNGKYSIGEIKTLDELKKHITIESGDVLLNSDTTSIYLNPVITNDNRRVKIEFATETPNYRKLKDLTEIEKRNIPSYSINEAKFFEGYESLVEDNEEAKKAKLALVNLSSDNKEMLKSQVFTDNYATYAKNLFESNENFENDRFNEYFKSQTRKNRVTVNTYKSKNFMSGENFTSFSKDFSSHNLKYNHKFNDKLEVGLMGSILNSNFEFVNKANFKNNAVSLGLNTNVKTKYVDFILENFVTYNSTKIRRSIKDEEVFSNLKSILFENSLMLKKDFEFKNNILSTFIGNNLQILSVLENDGENSDYSTQVLTTNLVNNKIFSGVDMITKITNKFMLENRIKLDFNFHKNLNLNVKTMGVKQKSKGQDLDVFNAVYNMNLKYRVTQNLNLNTNLSLNLKGNFGIGLSFDYEF
ncbi:S8 family serine peptidase [Oceanivirga miroungae]|uniref:Outer membrane autotransporter barrel domain-containing protein n=1 Tax=Oceanivirga miroungae TaxID=1130046 RepID=A0A6I8M4K4_9FUSO|nr:S8 family serine peptidase [Oceanivirga miroungae]VWL84834.1 outer membrane autotransporter barrel domain-containing protein [Oceanivirga miroungae]